MDSKTQVSTASGINVLAAIWLVIAPFVLGYVISAPRWNDVILGVIISVFAGWSTSVIQSEQHRAAI